jgi:hypothetical protein
LTNRAAKGKLPLRNEAKDERGRPGSRLSVLRLVVADMALAYVKHFDRSITCLGLGHKFEKQNWNKLSPHLHKLFLAIAPGHLPAQVVAPAKSLWWSHQEACTGILT